MRLDGFDMNLLKVFQALWAERSVSRAAQSLSLSQSATSAALSRLRHACNDELFVWDGHVMLPTPFAEQWASHVCNLLRETTLLLAEAERELAEANRAFVIASCDHIERLIGPPLLARLRRDAPNLTISVINATPSMITGAGTRMIDLFILPEGMVPQGCGRPQLLYRDTCVGLVSRAARGEQAQPLAALGDVPPHWPIAAGPGRASLSGGQGRHSGRFATSHFDFMADYAAVTQALAILPRHLAQAAARHAEVGIVELPDPAPVSEVSMHWRAMYERDPFHQWLRGTIQDLGVALQREIDARAAM